MQSLEGREDADGSPTGSPATPEHSHPTVGLELPDAIWECVDVGDGCDLSSTCPAPAG